MRNVRLPRQALSLATESNRQPYICRACLAQATRQYHATRPQNAEPFYKRMQDALFGSKEKKRSDELREAARKTQLENIKTEGELAVKTRVVEDVVYEIADVVDPTLHEDYVPASDWHGLEVVGGEAWVKQRADQGEQYTGFIPPKRAQLTDNEWNALLHHITAEVLTLKKAGRDVMQVCNARQSLDSGRAQTSGFTISNETGSPGVEFAIPEQEAQILASIPEAPRAGQVADGASVHDELAHATASGDTVQANFQLSDERVKLAILKRAMQLTGRRLPDIAMSRATTLSDLYKAFKFKEPAKKLYQAEEMQSLKEASNVQVLGRRKTVVDREKAVGRWKLIEEELDMRGLPLFGTKYRDAKERMANARMA